MKKMLQMMTIAVVLLGASLAQADISITPEISIVYGGTGAEDYLPAGSLVVWVAAGDDGEFSYSGTNVLGADGYTLPGSDDIVLGVSDSGGNLGQIAGTHYFSNVPDSAIGNKLGLLWFNADAIGKEDGAGEGISYGFWETDEVVPQDGTFAENFGKQGYGEVYGGTNTWTTVLSGGPLPESTFHADMTTIPEPFTMGVLAVGGLAMLRRRRAA